MLAYVALGIRPDGNVCRYPCTGKICGHMTGVTGRQGGASPATQSRPTSDEHADIVHLAPIVRRVVAARLHDPHGVDDVVQETLVRVMAARRRLDARGARSVCDRDSPKPDRWIVAPDRAGPPPRAPADRPSTARRSGGRAAPT